MSMVLLRKLDNRFQADLWRHALDKEGIPHRFRTFEDGAYDGLFVTQKGYGDIHVDPQWLDQAQQIDAELSQVAAGPPASVEQLAPSIEHTLLNPNATEADMEQHLAQCLEHSVVAACVSPWMVPKATKVLADSTTAVCSVVGFPLGTQSASTKAAEAAELNMAGAVELDLVLNRGLALGGDLEAVAAEVAGVRQAAPNVVLKVILEMSQLSDELVTGLAALCAEAGVDFLKTGSGYFGPAEVEQVELLLAAMEGLEHGPMGVKAAGGITTLDEALELLAAGADRLGTSAGAAIMNQAAARWTDAS